jgi:hypothetical protein
MIASQSLRHLLRGACNGHASFPVLVSRGEGGKGKCESIDSTACIQLLGSKQLHVRSETS